MGQEDKIHIESTCMLKHDPEMEGKSSVPGESDERANHVRVGQHCDERKKNEEKEKERKKKREEKEHLKPKLLDICWRPHVIAVLC